jgi:hypothetical protein
MNTDRLDSRVIEKINGKAWDVLRQEFSEINDTLLTMSSCSTGALTTIYVKYTSPETHGNPFGVVWIKKSTEIIVGLSLPAGIDDGRLLEAPKGCKYAGLTKYIVINSQQGVPEEFGEWCNAAFEEAARIK